MSSCLASAIRQESGKKKKFLRTMYNYFLSLFQFIFLTTPPSLSPSLPAFLHLFCIEASVSYKYSRRAENTRERMTQSKRIFILKRDFTIHFHKNLPILRGDREMTINSISGFQRDLSTLCDLLFNTLTRGSH